MAVEQPATLARDVPDARPRTVTPRNASGVRTAAAAAFASSLLLWVSFFPCNFAPAAWVALVPWLVLVRADVSNRARYGIAFLAGAAFYLPVLQWVRVADPRMYATWIGLALGCTAYLMATLWLIRRLDRAGWPLTLSVPVAWTAFEYMRGTAFTGFAWYFLAHSQHDMPALIQVSDVGGAYAVTFLVALVNAVVFEWLARRRPVAGTAVAAALLGTTLAYGVGRLQQNDFADGPRVALLQGNMDQRIKIMAKTGSESSAESMVTHFKRLHTLALTEGPRPDLVVWSETSYLDDFHEAAAGVEPGQLKPRVRQAIEASAELPKDAARYWKANELLGLNAQVHRADGKRDRYNSALLVTADGRLGGRYDKMHRVPFGEYVPFRESLPIINTLAPYDYDYSLTPGDRFTRFTLAAAGGRTYTFGVIICYEDSVPWLAPHYVRPGGDEPPVDFLVNMTNDGWFDGTSEHEQHLAISRFRAVECRRALVRAVNMGVSAVIDGNGQIVVLPAQTWAASKKMDAVVAADVPIDTRSSVYARFGDWLPAGCWVVAAIGVVGGLVRRRGGQG